MKPYPQNVISSPYKQSLYVRAEPDVNFLKKVFLVKRRVCWNTPTAIKSQSVGKEIVRFGLQS